MKRSITRWTTAVATAAVLGLPTVGVAQSTAQPTGQQPPREQPPAGQPPIEQPPAAQPPREQPPTAQPPSEQPPKELPSTQQPAAQPRPQMDQAASPQEHLRQAKAALDSIPAASVTGHNRTQLTALKRHMAALDRASTGTSGSTAGATGAAKSTGGATSGRPNTNWGAEAAAIDKTLTEMLGGAGTTGAPGAAGATGTTGTTGAAGTTGARSTDTMLDEATRAKLMEVRKHITAYAAAMSGGQPAPKREEAAAATASPASPAESPAAPTSASPSQEASAVGAAAAPATGLQTQTPEAADAAASKQVDPEAARRHLVAARDSLNQLTQLPAAAQLTGEARTHVTQLISNFNELVTTQTDWRASYGKVAANMAALLGPVNTAADTAVGTSSTATADIDPAVRAKLVEMRRNLSEFEKASGGAEKK